MQGQQQVRRYDALRLQELADRLSGAGESGVLRLHVVLPLQSPSGVTPNKSIERDAKKLRFLSPLMSCVRRPHRLSRIGATASTYTTNPPASSAAPQIGFVRHITRLIVAHPSLYPIGAHIPSARPSGHQVNQSTESTSNSHVQPPAPNSALKSDALRAPFSSALLPPKLPRPKLNPPGRSPSSKNNQRSHHDPSRRKPGCAEQEPHRPKQQRNHEIHRHPSPNFARIWAITRFVTTSP